MKMPLVDQPSFLEVSKLSFSVAGKALIEDINLSLKQPGITLIMGPNGAGKSLLIRLLHGLLDANSGEIRWHGKSLDLAVRKTQAMVFQKPVLLRRSVAANIDFVLDGQTTDRAHQCNRILEQAGLRDQASQPARRLSGGEQQRLALARALAIDPKVLLLDEPTASLDPASTSRIEKRLQQASESGIKLILVTHDIGQARRLAQDVIFMHQGRVQEHSSAKTFFDSPSSEAARAYLDGQLLL